MQLRMSIVLKFFEKKFKEKYNLEDYNSINKPTIFCGIYRQSDRFALQNHKGPMIIILSGSDTEHKRTVMRVKKTIRGRGDRKVLVFSKWIEEDCKKFDVPCVKIPLLRSNIFLWR